MPWIPAQKSTLRLQLGRVPPCAVPDGGGWLAPAPAFGSLPNVLQGLPMGAGPL